MLKRIVQPEFFIGNLGNTQAPDEVLSACNKFFSQHQNEYRAEVGDDGVNTRIRNCYVDWIPTTTVNFINTGLAKIIHHINDQQFNLQLDQQWETNLQYTKYIDKGHFFDWHQDAYADQVTSIRKISIVYCLSHKKDYTGGEFQIKQKDSTYTTKFDYGDFIVFPSNVLHRVKPLKKGQRITIVGWYY